MRAFALRARPAGERTAAFVTPTVDRAESVAPPRRASGDRPRFSFQSVRVLPRREVAVTLPPHARRRLVEGSPPSAVTSLGAGRPLSRAERALAPAAFDGLTDVRVHDGESARLAAALLGDAGYTFATDVVLADGAPSKARDRLLAHELVHVLQQRASARRGPAADPEGEAEALSRHGVVQRLPGQAARAFAEMVIARYTRNLPNNLMLIIDVDDGDFVGGCVRAIVPHLGVKLVLRGVPRAAGNLLFNLHLGVFTNPAGESCFFFYESVSGACETLCAPTLDELKRKLREIRDWLKEKIENLLRVILPVAVAAAVAYVIADILVAALAAAGILVAA